VKLLRNVILIGSLFATAAFANLLTNGSFENGVFTPDASGAQSLPVGSTVITGWTTVVAGVAWIGQPNTWSFTAEDGSKGLDLTGYEDATPYGGVEQTLPSLAAGTYVLTFWVQNPAGAQVTVTVGAQTPVLVTKAVGGWEKETVNFTTAGGSTAIDLVGTSSPRGNFLGFDNVDLEQVPEPVMGLPVVLSLGLFGLFGLARRKRARQ
jgi:hypothetical protein